MKPSVLRTFLAAATLLLTLPMLAAGTFTVTTVADSGPGSLRQAILSAKAAQGGTIVFAIDSGLQTIRPTSTLPDVIQTTIDGRTQPGFTGTPLIELDGSLLGSGHMLTVIRSAVHGLVVNRGPSVGIVSSDSRISRCYIGTDHTGMLARPNSVGIDGTGLFDNNLVAGNTNRDMSVGLASTVDENLLGTDATGNAILSDAARQVRLTVSNSGGRPGPITISRNVIAGGEVGIAVSGGSAIIRDNFIGVSRSGTPLPNDFGVTIFNTPDVALTANRIAHNTRTGVWVSGRGSLRTRLVNNSIHSNDFGIDLGSNDGPTLNDAGDGDLGPNNLTNFPVITRAVLTANGIGVFGTLDSHPNTVYAIELFTTPSCDDSGYGEGQKRVDRFSITTDSSGHASFTKGIAGTFTAGHVVTGTADSVAEGTSEFSRCALIEGPGQFSVTQFPVLTSESAGTIKVQVNRTDGSVGPATVQYATVNGSATAGNDYTPVSGTLTFADGETQKSVGISILNDLLFEGEQAFTLVLSNPTGATLSSANVATILIQDNEGQPFVTMNNVQRNEGNSGPNPLTFTVRLSNPVEGPYTFTYFTQDASAFAGSDYTATSGTLTFNSGETQKTIVVTVDGDTLFEFDEFFFLELRRGGFLVRRARGLLFNDDAPPTVTVNDVEVRETDGMTKAVITFTATGPVEGGIAFGTIHGGTATPGQDFVPRGGQVTFDNQTTATVEIDILGDQITEEHEQFTIRLWNSFGNFVLHDDAVVVTILDDDIGVGPDRLMVPVGDSRRGLIQVGAPVATDTLFLLSSSAPDAIGVPASVIMPAGQSRVTFDIHALAPGRRGEVTVTFPASIADGSAQIRVWTYTKAELTLSPSELTLYPGQVVTVHASMTPTGAAVSIPLTSESNVEVPERLELDATGHGSFTVKALANGPFVITATLPAAYGSEERHVVGRVADPPSIPTLISISPNNGSTAGGTRIDVHGALFRTDCELTFGGIPATMLQYVDASTLTAIAPPQAAGPVDVALTCGTDVATLRNAFTYRGVGPHLSSIAPSTGATTGGTFVRITGQDFASSCWPFFGETASPEAIVRDANTITAVAPPHAAGTVDVRLLCTGNNALLAGAFTFTTVSDPAAQIINIAPPFGAPGDIVTIEGTGFRPDDVVSFDNVVARVLDSTPDTHTVVVPNLAPGRVSVTIGTGTTVLATTGPIFIVGEASPPRISRVVPATAAAGAEIVLEGTSMRAPYTFAIEGVTMPLVSLLPTRAVVRVPAGLTPGTYPIAVMNAANQIATLGPAINVRAEGVVVSGVAANCGATDGGIDVTITGSGFAAGAAVTFDDVPATNVVVIDATRIQARVPANYAGAATIMVKNTDGSSSTLTDAFRYASPFDPSGCTSRRVRAVRH